jgi:hypothetical protein
MLYLLSVCEIALFTSLFQLSKCSRTLRLDVSTQPQDVSKEELKERIEAAATPDHEAAEERIILILMQSELKKDPEIDRLLADKEKHPVGYFYYVVL